MFKMNKKIIISALIIIIFLGVLFRVLSLNKDIGSEESDFVNAAKAISNTGHPIFYDSEIYPRLVFLLHPPFYIYLMSLVSSFSTNEIALRSINVIFSILVVIFIILFCTKIMGGKKGYKVGLISASLFMICYYTLSSSLIIDIDVLSTFFMFGFLYSFIQYYKTNRLSYFNLSWIFLLGGIFNRYPIAFILYVSIGAYHLLNKDLRKHLKYYLLIGLISILFFIAFWGFYSNYIEPGTFFSFFEHNFRMGEEQFSNALVYFGSFTLNIIQLIRLVTLPLVILSIWSIISLFKMKNKLINILLIYTLSILIFFIFVPRPAFGYPRYFLTLFPGLFILVGIFIKDNVNFEKINKKEFFIFLCIFLMSLLILIFLNPQSTIYESSGLIKATNLPDLILNIFGIVPVFFVLFFKDKRKAMIIVLFVLALSYSLYFDVKYITNDIKTKEVGEYIKEHTNTEDIILSSKSIAYYAERRYYINVNNKPEISPSLSYIKEYIVKSWENKEMNNSFFWPKGFYGGLYSPIPTQSELDKISYVVLYHQINGSPPEKIIGEFYIYNLKQLSI